MIMDGQPVRGALAGFVLGHDREFYMAEHIAGDVAQELYGGTAKGFKHSSYFSGQNVLFGGGIRIENGYIKDIGSGSGHYKPNKLQLLHCLQALVAHGASLEEIDVGAWAPDDRGKVVELWGSAALFLRSSGRTINRARRTH